MDSPEKYKSNLAFVDLLFNVLLGFVFLFLIAFILINPIAKKADIDMLAQYMIVMSWPGSSDNDIDMWVMDPNGNRVGFFQREIGFMNLDRDDLGSTTDLAEVDGELQKVEINREVVSLRGIVPGEYYVTVHLYTKREEEPTPVKVEVIRVTPYEIVYSQEKTLTYFGERSNFYKFSLNADGTHYGVESTEQSAMQ